MSYILIISIKGLGKRSYVTMSVLNILVLVTIDRWGITNTKSGTKEQDKRVVWNWIYTNMKAFSSSLNLLFLLNSLHMGIIPHISMNQCYQWQLWWKAKILPHKHAIVAYGATTVGLPSQIADGRRIKKHHIIVLWWHYNGNLMTLLWTTSKGVSNPFI